MAITPLTFVKAHCTIEHEADDALLMHYGCGGDGGVSARLNPAMPGIRVRDPALRAVHSTTMPQLSLATVSNRSAFRALDEPCSSRPGHGARCLQARRCSD